MPPTNSMRTTGTRRRSSLRRVSNAGGPVLDAAASSGELDKNIMSVNNMSVDGAHAFSPSAECADQDLSMLGELPPAEQVRVLQAKLEQMSVGYMVDFASPLQYHIIIILCNAY
jgi:hypothetical protein